MAFDQPTRNRLQRFVSEARSLLSEEFTKQLQNEYALDPISGFVTPLEKLSFLDDARLETARVLRQMLEHFQAGTLNAKIQESLDIASCENKHLRCSIILPLYAWPSVAVCLSNRLPTIRMKASFSESPCSSCRCKPPSRLSGFRLSPE